MLILPPAGTRAHQQIPQTKETTLPQLTRQSPPKQVQAAQPTFSTGSVLSTAVPVSFLREECVKVCLYGRNRSGKTTLAAQFPKPVLFISCEPANCGGVQSVSEVPDCTVVRAELKPIKLSDGTFEKIAGRKKIVALAEELKQVNHFKTVVLKTATSLQKLVEDEMKAEFPEMPWSGRGSKDTYGMRASRVEETIRPLLDLKHVHGVFLCQEKDHNPPTDDRTGFPDLKAKLLQNMQQGSFVAAALGPALVTWLHDACGYIIQILEEEVTEEISVPTFNPDGTPGAPSVQRVGTGRRQRHLRLKYHPNFAAGGKWNFDPDMPEFVTAPTPAKLYSELARYIPALRRNRG